MTPGSPSVTTPLSPPAAPAPRRRSRARPVVFVTLPVTPAQVESATRAAVDGVEAALLTLLPQLPSAFHGSKVVAGVSRSALSFTLTMAAVQESYSGVLGALPSDPQAMRSSVDMLTVAQATSARLRRLLVVLDNLGHYAARQAHQDARVIYQHAQASALVNPALARVIAPVQDARSRPGRKAAVTRARNLQLRAGAPQADGAAEAPRTTTIVTTSQR